MRFAYPKQTQFGRHVAKSKIYAMAKPSTRVQSLFKTQVKRITWQHKLATSTLNLPSSQAVPEIQVFHIQLNETKLDDQVLQTIDRAIPLPIVFEVEQAPGPKAQAAMVAAYKRPSEADSTKWVTSAHQWGPWHPIDTPRQTLPSALDLESLYTRLLEPLVTVQPRAELPPEPEPTQTAIADKFVLAEAIDKQTRLVTKLQAKVRNTKQFNKQVAVNAELRQAMNDLQAMQQAAQN